MVNPWQGVEKLLFSGYPLLESLWDFQKAFQNVFNSTADKIVSCISSKALLIRI